MSRLTLGVAGVLALATPARGQFPPQAPAAREALEILRRDNAWTLEQQASICEIPAPPFGEEARGRELRHRLNELGWRETSIDAVGNVIAVHRGTGQGPRVVLSAHLDTVFPEGTDVRVHREGVRMRGPGIGDDCRGLAVVLAVARAVRLAGIRTAGDLVIVGTVGEEGPGNLRGVRHLFEAHSAGRVDAFISVDGTGLGLTTQAVGSNRYRVTISGPGGHSYGDFGMPNPVHALGRAIAAIADLEVPATPRTVFNVGVIEGGVSVNSIASTASMQVDLRSASPLALAALDSAFRRAVALAVEPSTPDGRAPGPASLRSCGTSEGGRPPVHQIPPPGPSGARGRPGPGLSSATGRGLKHRRQHSDEPGDPRHHPGWRRPGWGAHTRQKNGTMTATGDG